MFITGWRVRARPWSGMNWLLFSVNNNLYWLSFGLLKITVVMSSLSFFFAAGYQTSISCIKISWIRWRGGRCTLQLIFPPISYLDFAWRTLVIFTCVTSCFDHIQDKFIDLTEEKKRVTETWFLDRMMILSTHGIYANAVLLLLISSQTCLEMTFFRHWCP